jgi:hypothetical protein
MIKTLAALLILSTAAWAQDNPKEGDKPRREGDRPRPPQDGDQPRPPREGDKPRPPKEGDKPRPFRETDEPRPPGFPRDGQRPPGSEGNPGRRSVPQFNPEEVREWLKDNEPETFRRLNQIQGDGHREEVMRIMGDASMRMRDMSELKQRDPKAYEKMQAMRSLERESMELAEKARRGPPEEKEAATKKLLENLGKQFELREEQRLREIAELKRRVEGLEKTLTERKTSKEKIVERRKKELLGEKLDEDW